MNRWIVYQRERFPLLSHAPLIAAFSVSAVCFSALLRGSGPPSGAALIVAFVTALLFFLQLRISDEFKDADEDARYRPYRPVPRGLVSLHELRRIGAAAALVQVLLAFWLHPALLLLLVVPWGWFALMSRGFFAGSWLRRRPALYVATHMMILPLVDLYATACDWLVSGAHPPRGLVWFLLVSYANGVVIEIGRKTRAPADEEPNVETYSALWGAGTAVSLWLGALMITAGLALQAASLIEAAAPILALLIALLVICATTAICFLRRQEPRSGRTLETAAGVWTLCIYLSLGTVPLVVQRLGIEAPWR
jgi:4-hydroxybenzoate polyprenyltransferase